MLHSDNARSKGSGFRGRRIAPRLTLLTLLTLLCGLVVLVISPAARADQGGFVVAEFQGAKPMGIRERVVELMRGEGYTLVDDADIPAVDAAESDSYFAGLAREAGHRGFVLGYTSMKSNGWTTSITVRDGKTGEVLGKTSIGAGWYPGLLKALDQKLMPRIGGYLDKAQAPEQGQGAGAKPAVVEEEKEQPTSPTDDWSEDESVAEDADDEPSASVDEDDVQEAVKRHKDKNKRRDAALVLDAGGLFVQRQWSLVDPVAGPADGPMLASHDVPMFGIQGSLALYPIAFFSDSFLRHVGLTLGYQRSYKARTTLPSTPNRERATLFEELDFGGRIRIPIGEMTLGLVGGGGAQALSVSGVNSLDPHPDPVYQYWYAGVDYSLPVAKTFSLDAALHYRGLTGAGEAYGQIQAPEWFPDTTGSGFGASLDGTLMFTEWLGARLGAHFLRYALAFEPSLERLQEAANAGEPAPPVVGGATDTYWGLDLGLVLSIE